LLDRPLVRKLSPLYRKKKGGKKRKEGGREGGRKEGRRE
jgi:hypothetical protein